MSSLLLSGLGSQSKGTDPGFPSFPYDSIAGAITAGNGPFARLVNRSGLPQASAHQNDDPTVAMTGGGTGLVVTRTVNFWTALDPRASAVRVVCDGPCSRAIKRQMAACSSGVLATFATFAAVIPIVFK